ncbi:hypothetical protein M9Y10_010400 [Tritrichomonas musculus]|uniref:Uncharacterized protein n=1 Tax=Tritrichomonas musculus TaxID=1915356 RepID=A0ABR2IKS7_9EUKA
MEVSNDGKSSEEVDRRYNDQTLNGSNITHNFKLANERDGFYRFIKLRTTGPSWCCYPSSDGYYAYFYFVEFFGKLDEHA